MKEKLLKNLKAKGLKTDVFQYDLFSNYELTKNLTKKPKNITTFLINVPKTINISLNLS